MDVIVIVCEPPEALKYNAVGVILRVDSVACWSNVVYTVVLKLAGEPTDAVIETLKPVLVVVPVFSVTNTHTIIIH